MQEQQEIRMVKSREQKSEHKYVSQNALYCPYPTYDYARLDEVAEEDKSAFIPTKEVRSNSPRYNSQMKNKIAARNKKKRAAKVAKRKNRKS